MRVRSMLTLAALAVLVPGSRQEAKAAECPGECSQQKSDLICRIEEHQRGDQVTRLIYYYGNLVR